MHIIFRESHGLEDQETPFDLEQTPADLIALSFSDSDLGAFAAGWHRADGALPETRLANIVALKHPLSVDTWIDQTARHAKGILVRLLGGEAYWPYVLPRFRTLPGAKASLWPFCLGTGAKILRLTRSPPCPFRPFAA